MTQADHTPNLQNRRVLVLEDDALVAMAVEALLQDAGYTALVVAELDRAVLLAEKEPIDLAFLDVSIIGRDSFIVAETLAQRGIPYLFTTAHDSRNLPPRYSAQPVLYKPYAGEELLEAVSLILAAAPAPAEPDQDL